MGKRLLIVCDHVAVVALFSRPFAESGFDILSTTKSNEAETLVSTYSIDVVFINYYPPGTPPDALTLCRRLRDTYPRLTIVMVSPSNAAALAAGATQWFDIIFDINDIVHYLRRVTS